MHHRLDRFLRNLVMPVLGILAATTVAAQEFPGGFVEEPGTAAPRPGLTASEVQAFLPERGKFTFPDPYATTGVRLTNASDCGGSNCVNYVGYSYWRNMNNHVGEDVMLILLGLDRSRGGDGPSLISYNKATDEVVNLGPIFQESDPLSWGNVEGWYFSATRPYEIYIPNHSKLLRYDVVTNERETVFDVTELMGSGYYIWQLHSSSDDRVHSATLREEGTYRMLGCMVYSEDTGQHDYFPSQGDFDECQVDKSGEWLLIKENLDGLDGEDNRIINLRTGEERIVLDSEGAAGHSDMGYGYMVAADNWGIDPNTWKLWDFNAAELAGVAVYHNNSWDMFAPSHVSHANADAGLAPEQQYACGSSVNRSDLAEANEILCFPLDGSNDKALIVAPVMTDLDAGGASNNYAKAPKGNLDVTGKYFIWTSNMGGSRLDAFLVKVPSHLLSLDGASTNPDTTNPDTTDPDTTNPDTTDPDTTDPTTSGGGSATAVAWSDLVNAVVDGSTLIKNGGCDGCADAGAVSQQEIASGDGSLEFTVDETQNLRFVGLSVNQAATEAGQIDFALRIQAGYAEVRENGVYRDAIGVSVGDVLQIAIKGGAVSYARNGQVFYSSTAAPAYPLRAYATLFSGGSTVSDARIHTGGSDATNPDSTTPAPSQPEPTATLGAPESVSWYKLVNSRVKGGTVIKRGGCDGCADAGAKSQQEIGADGGYFEFTVDDIEPLRFAGLSTNQRVTDAGDIDFALRIQAGYAEVRENGSYRTAIDVYTGDVLRITVEEGVVSYSLNGAVFYTSGVAPAYPMRAYATLFTKRSMVSDAVMAIAR